jgi:hypothetical protein
VAEGAARIGEVRLQALREAVRLPLRGSPVAKEWRRMCASGSCTARRSSVAIA